MNVDGFIWEVWRCLHFKSIWLDSLEWFKAYLWGLNVVRLVWNQSRCFELKEMLFECLKCKKAYVSAFECNFRPKASYLNDWRVQRTPLRENAFIWMMQGSTWMIKKNPSIHLRVSGLIWGVKDLTWVIRVSLGTLERKWTYFEVKKM